MIMITIIIILSGITKNRTFLLSC